MYSHFRGIHYDEIESSVSVEVGLRRVLSKNEVGSEYEVLVYDSRVAAKSSTITVGRWMSKTEAAAMRNGSPAAVGAGGKTSVTVGGSNAWGSAPKGSVYVEFQVPTNSLVPGVEKVYLVFLDQMQVNLKCGSRIN
ncbi:MAG TPA: hypothetical protein ENJ82_16585 [Bacteroidetes bacterium]|nr:hypothetical protein [Bacteroidota bacterium]